MATKGTKSTSGNQYFPCLGYGYQGNEEYQREPVLSLSKINLLEIYLHGSFLIWLFVHDHLEFIILFECKHGICMGLTGLGHQRVDLMFQPYCPIAQGHKGILLDSCANMGCT